MESKKEKILKAVRDWESTERFEFIEQLLELVPETDLQNIIDKQKI